MRGSDFHNIQEEGHRSTVVLEMDGLRYKRMVVGRAPGICSEAQMSKLDGQNDLLVASFQFVPSLFRRLHGRHAQLFCTTEYECVAAQFSLDDESLHRPQS